MVREGSISAVVRALMFWSGTFFGLVLHRRGEAEFPSERLSTLIDGYDKSKLGFRGAAFRTLTIVYVRVGPA